MTKTPNKENNFQSRLSEILKQMEGSPEQGETDISLGSIQSAQAAITDLVLETIGDDLPLNTEPNTGQRIHNKVKADLRKQVRGSDE